MTTFPLLLAPVGAKDGNGFGRRDDWRPGDGPMGRWDMHDGVGWGWWLLVGLLVLLLVAVAVTVVLLLLRRPPGTGGGTGGPAGTAGAAGVPRAAEQLLDERFARGEIDEQEYLHRRGILRSP